jgi:hypothetical protein
MAVLIVKKEGELILKAMRSRYIYGKAKPKCKI